MEGQSFVLRDLEVSRCVITFTTPGQDSPHLQQLNRDQLNILTNSVRHSRHNHDLLSHRVDIVHLELADAGVERSVEQIHKVN